MTTPQVSGQVWCRTSLDDIDIDPLGRPRRPVVIVTSDGSTTEPALPSRPGPIVVLVIARDARPPHDLFERADVVLASDGSHADAVVVDDPLADAVTLAARIETTPVAALTVARLLRHQLGRGLAAGLDAESTAYSTLLAGAEFSSWRHHRPARPAPSLVGPPALVESDRRGRTLRLTLTNTERRNAFSARLRDELIEALQPAVWDTSLDVEVHATGPTSGAGGDLDEFGLASDVALAHLTRVTASAGAVLDGLGARLTVFVHGRCFGAGIEVPAFAARVVARPGTTFTLPELSMGLLPGAGGTVSIARRIGRRRTAWLALSGAELDVSTALEWGLVDRVE